MNSLILFGTATGVSGAASALESNLTADAVWGAITPFIPIVVSVALIALSVTIIRRVVKKASKGKAGM